MLPLDGGTTTSGSEMGASTPYACNYGALPRQTKPPHITTGHAATAAMLKDWAIHCCNELDLEFGKTKLALFGAAGRLGTTVAKYLLYKETPTELVLIDLPDKVNLLADQARELMAADLLGRTKVSVHTFSPDTPLPQFDGAILASSTSVPYLTAADLKRARFWIDDSHPRAASVEAELASRGHTLYIECFARGPAGLDSRFPFRLPTTRDCYTCFAEGYAAWQEGIASGLHHRQPACVVRLLYSWPAEKVRILGRTFSRQRRLGDQPRSGRDCKYDLTGSSMSLEAR